MKPSCPAVALAVVLLTATGSHAEAPCDAPGNGNPLVPGYFADPTIRKFGDTFYLYATTDGTGGGRGPSQVWVSKDFVNWTLQPMNWPTTPFIWAPDVVQGDDGRYYMYYSQPCQIYGGVSETPLGPWTSLLPDNAPVVPDHLIKPVITLDGQILRDDDGSRYMYWGTWGVFKDSGCGVGKLKADMKSFSDLSLVPNTDAKDFFEGPFPLKRNGIYYLMYSSGSCHTDSYCVQYAMGKSPTGQFRFGPNNPILSTSADKTVHGPGHHSVLQLGEDYYIVYHRHDNPYTPNGMHRQVAADRLVFEPDGSIRKVVPTHKGVGALGPIQNPFPNLAYRRPVTASSFYRDALRKHDFKPEFAVDDNNGTLWKPADNQMGHWLQVDLGEAQPIRRVHTQFEYATWYYQYLIEHSTDGQQWHVFSDKRENRLSGSPMVDSGDVRARYLKITVTGVERPGLYGAIWNLKAFGGAATDPPLLPKGAPYRQIAPPAPKPQGLLVHLDARSLQLGTVVERWENKGVLGGQFASPGARPFVDVVSGVQAVRFTGRECLRSPFPKPRSLSGNGSFTVAVWALNETIADAECLVSWSHRGGPDASSGCLHYGSHPAWGAAAHWGFADMPYRGGPPAAGQWHHIALVFDGTTERLYVDGRLNNQSTKMLFLHENDPIFIGAADGNTEFLDGYIASVRVYDIALGEDQIVELAKESLASDLLVHLDASKLGYGPAREWANRARLGGKLTADATAPSVVDAGGRIALQFDEKARWTSTFSLPADLTEKGAYGLVLVAHCPGGRPLGEIVNWAGGDGLKGLDVRVAATEASPWRHVAVTCDGRTRKVYVDGKPVAEAAAVPGAPAGGPLVIGGFKGAIALLQVQASALTEDQVGALHRAWEATSKPFPASAAFAKGEEPRALSTVAVAMRAAPTGADRGAAQFCFEEATGNPGGAASGWLDQPLYINHGLRPNTRYTYTVKVRDAFGNVTRPSEPAQVTTDAGQFEEYFDDFGRDHDYVVGGCEGTPWQGRIADDRARTKAEISARGGVLRMGSESAWWDNRPPRGLLLYRVVKGDFVAETKIADYEGLARKQSPANNDGGIMARVPEVEQGGPGEDLVQLSFFPIYNVGNMWTSLDSPNRPQGNNRLAWDAHRYLQIERRGDAFHLRTSADGLNWAEMPGSPIMRLDMNGLPVQVGPFHAMYSANHGFVAYHYFRLSIPRKPR